MQSIQHVEDGLSYANAVARERVHRDAICEVFLTDVVCRGDAGIVVGVQLPRSHSYYSDHLVAAPRYDPLLVVEAFRQTAIVVAHEYANAPVGSKFVFNSASFDASDAPGLYCGTTSACGRIIASVANEKVRNGVITGISLDMELTLEGQSAAKMSMTIQWMPGPGWDKVRARGRGGLCLDPKRAYATGFRMSPADVGRWHHNNVVLLDARSLGRRIESGVVVDESHPSLFDHPLDHIPGALLFEAYRQCGIVAMHELLGLSPKFVALTGVEVVFTRFGELELPTDCAVELVDRTADGGAVLSGVISQDGCAIATATLRFAHITPFNGSRGLS